MRRTRKAALVALGAAAATLLAACGGGGGSATGGGGGEATQNAGVGAIANPSDQKGGTLRFANSGDWDSLDPADTYYAYSWNFVRYYGRSLVVFQSAPGADGAKLVPDLAESLGQASPDQKTWTYTLRQGVKFEDGTPITSKDVKYAVERSLDKETFPNGPTYFNDLLDVQGYTSPYQDASPDKLGLAAVETPDDRTIVFKLVKPFAGFDYIAQLPATIPVPQAADTGTRYKEKVVSSGPYKFETNELGKSFTLVRNENWDPATDPNRKALPDRIEVALNVNADDIDNRLQSGDLDVAVEGSGVGAAAQGKILADQALRANTDSALTSRTWFSVLSASVTPLDNIECRKAVLYAVDKTGYQRAYGGATGGDIATSLLPPVIPGAESYDPYATAGNAGDLDRAKQALAACGQPNGFTTGISYRAERPREKAVAEALQQSLARVGINLEIKPYPAGDYFKLYAGKPDFVKSNNLGILVYGWAADWPDGYGFLSQIVDSRVIRDAGNTNLGIVDPKIDAMVDQALVTGDAAGREKIWAGIDKQVMDDAFVIPGIWAKGLLYRPPTLTNVFVTDGFSMYDYAAMGTTRQ
ncbi:ABC transporter substrate-binding protein [Pseudonocardia sp.]|uniref:ABC transporter substrate-binding protein n=1 Tax=Pseudonocardia sp. TaxID=60912 RepID=UPI003D13621C